MEKPWVVAVNKCDLGRPLDPAMLPRTHYISAQSRTGLKPLLESLWKEVQKARGTTEGVQAVQEFVSLPETLPD
jgi:50S ribosomal subunit-associated GTPase HflX